MKKKVATIATATILSSTFTTTVFADTYKVQAGDTLYHIAKKYNTTVTELKNINSLTSDLIYVNQSLTVPGKTVTYTPSNTPAPTISVSAPKLYTVVSGDTLIKIANRHNISVAELMSWNNITSHLIYPGQVFIVAQSSTNSTPESVTTQPPASAPAEGTISTEYVIKSGDYLGKIAREFKVTVAQLKSWNNLSSDLIYPGQKLKVQATATPNTPAAPPVVNQPTPPANPAPVTPPSNTEDAGTGEYVIKSGDTLGKIAAQYGMTVGQLKSMNGLTSDLIFPGQKLKVSGQASSGGQSGSSEVTPDSGSTETSSVVDIARKLIGTPYVWGGSTPSGFDCSGFIYYVYKQADSAMKRYSSEGYYDRSYYVDSPQVGDLVFFKDTYKSGISHLGIYVGNNEFIHADANGVKITSLNNSYWKEHFESFKRFY